MKTVSIRKQGGAAIMTIPPDILKSLHAEVGSILMLDVQDGTFIAKPVSPVIRKRFKLSELLENVTPQAMQQLNAETEWAREGSPVGQEL
jgi:antitoxin ChpS